MTRRSAKTFSTEPKLSSSSIVGLELGLACFLGGVLLPLFIVGGDFSPRDPAALVYSWLLAVFSALRISMLMATAKRHYLCLTYWIFIYVFLGLSATVQLLEGQSFFIERFLGAPFSSSTQLRAVILVWVGVLAGELGMYQARRSRSRSRRPRDLGDQRTYLNLRRLRLYSWMAILASGLAIAALGGPQELLRSRGDLSGDILSIDGGLAGAGVGAIVAVALRFPPYVCLGLWLWWRRGPSGPRYEPGDLLVVIALLVNVLLVTNPISTPRFLVGTVSLGFLFTLTRRSSPLQFRIGLFSILVVLILVFPYLDTFRRSTDRQIVLRGIADQFVEKQDYAMYQQVQIGMEYVEQFGHTDGTQLLGSLFFFVPRPVWPGKPGDTGDLTITGLGFPDRLNTSSPLWLEFYVDGGWVFVVAGSWAFAFAIRRLDDISPDRFADARGYTGALVPLVAPYTIFLLRGSLLASMPRLLVLVALVGVPFATLARRSGYRTSDSRPAPSTFAPSRSDVARRYS